MKSRHKSVRKSRRRKSVRKSRKRKSVRKSRKRSRTSKTRIRKNPLSMEYARMFGSKDATTTIKKGPKGVSLFARKPIKKNQKVAYYKFKLYPADTYSGKNNDMYMMSVYSKSGRYISRLSGDIYEGSLEYPKNGVTYWAYFSNEPSKHQKENCFLDENRKYNFKNRDGVRAGQTLTYVLIANRNIRPGEEIVWCYGESYERNYKPNCA